MGTRILLGVLGLAVASPMARADTHLKIDDGVDDSILILGVSGQRPVKEFTADLQAFTRTLTATDRGGIEKLLGKPGGRAAKKYAMPVAQPRGFVLGGLGVHGEPAYHPVFYALGDFGGVEVWYKRDAITPLFVLVYLAVDDAFPRLTRVKEKAAPIPAAPPKAIAAARKHTIDTDHWNKLAQRMTKEQVAELFSVPAGDYAPGTEYLTRSSGWREGGPGKAHQKLEWRAETVRIEVDFDAEGKFVASEFYLAGRDPVTYVADRLKWDRERFDKLKKYVEERRAARSRYTTEASASVARLDYLYEDKLSTLCIFKVGGDTLTVCYSVGKDRSRPKEFGQPSTNTLTFTRVKAKD